MIDIRKGKMNKVKKPSWLNLTTTNTQLSVGDTSNKVICGIYRQRSVATYDSWDEVDVERIIKWLNQYLKWYNSKKR